MKNVTSPQPLNLTGEMIEASGEMRDWIITDSSPSVGLGISSVCDLWRNNPPCISHDRCPTLTIWSGVEGKFSLEISTFSNEIMMRYYKLFILYMFTL